MESPGINLSRKGAMPPSDPREQRIQRTSNNFSPLLWNGHPLETMMRLSRDMDQLMGTFLHPQGAATTDFWQPRIDVRQEGDQLLISAELPGITRQDVRLETTDDGLAISGERGETREDGGRGQNYHLTERSYGSFYRAIPLPEGALAEQARATMRDGVLEITVPYKPSTQRRQIPIGD
jgi:HSP20 family protein